MIVREDSGYDMDVKVKWISNISRQRNEANTLLGAHDILLSEI